MDTNERFERIYNETRDEILRFLIVRTNADAEAEDLFQEVYRRFYCRLCNSFLPILEPKRYLFSIAKKVLSKYYRQKANRVSKEQPITEETEYIAQEEPIDERLLRNEQKDAVWQLLQHEPELNRKAFILYYGYDRTQKEIASALGITEAAVRQRIYRTRHSIRALLETDQPDAQEESK